MKPKMLTYFVRLACLEMARQWRIKQAAKA